MEGRGYHNAATVGRNTLRAGGIINFRWDALNALNHPQWTQAPARTVLGMVAGRFLNPDFTDARTRLMWGQVKAVF